VINLQSFVSHARDKKIQLYDHSNKKKRTLVAEDVEATEFVSVCFSGLNEKLLATLTGGLQVILWQWDKQRKLAGGDCQSMPPTDKALVRMLQISFSNSDPNHLLVTGKDLFKFFKVDNTNMKIMCHQIAKKEADVSATYTCHTWLPDGRIAVCNDMG
jgi:hypothetical protein